ncbi:MAG: TAXI family TRAP transporter solute-binding subunit [Gemmatimonadetes bacterium]|nr:TAXI family TRAP transporter solute-binding subunit [Gemmatimonadota bacterium]
MTPRPSLRWRPAVAAFVLAAASGVACGSQPGEPAADAFVGFAGGPSGGSFFPAAGAVATVAQQQIPELKVSVEGTGGSGENVRLVGNRDSDMGVAYGADLHAGYFGTEDFAGAPQADLRAVGLLFWGYGHLVTLKSSGIQAIADLAGKRLDIGGAGTGSALTGERLFGHLGLLDKMRVSYLGGSAASAALKDGQVDAYHWVSGVPNAAVLDTVATHDVVLLDLATAAEESGFLEAYPFYAAGEIPAGAYRGIAAPVRTILIGTYWIVNRGVSDDVVYDMARAAYSSKGYAFARQAFEPLKDMTPDQALQGLTVPLHAGAERYWAELGLDIPERLRAR